MKGLKKLFGIVSSIRPQIGNRVMNKDTRELGFVIGKAEINGTIKVPAISVLYDNGNIGTQISENEFVKVGK